MRKIILFLFEGVELFEVASFTDIFGWNNIVGTKDILLETVSYKEMVNCSWGGNLKVNKIITKSNIEEFYKYDVLVIPGGFGKFNFFRDKKNENFQNLVKYFFENKKYIIAICSGVLNLLSTQYINNVKMTTYLLDNQRYFKQLKDFDIEAVEEEICIDKNIMSCSGAGNSIELALKLLEILTDKENRNIVMKNMFL